MLDFHNHLIPAVDDGAANLSEAREGLAALMGQGATRIITTPHCGASLLLRRDGLDRYFDRIDAGWGALVELAGNEFSSLELHRGVELMLDVPRPDLSDARLRLAGSAFVLVEFPHMAIPPNSSVAVRNIRSDGYLPIIAHPERYSNMKDNLMMLEEWRDAGAYLQINAGSLVGRYGATARSLAWNIVYEGAADFMCSDYHSRGECYLRRGVDELTSRGGAAQARRLTEVNPARILTGESPLAVDRLEPEQLPLWQRVFSRR